MRFSKVDITFLILTVFSALTLPFAADLNDGTTWQALVLYTFVGLITLLIAFPLVRAFHPRYSTYAKRFNHLQAFLFGFSVMGVLTFVLWARVVIFGQLFGI